MDTCIYSPTHISVHQINYHNTMIALIIIGLVHIAIIAPVLALHHLHIHHKIPPVKTVHPKPAYTYKTLQLKYT